MRETPSSPSEGEQRLERLLADYLHAVAAGVQPDREELLARQQLRRREARVVVLVHPGAHPILVPAHPGI